MGWVYANLGVKAPGPVQVQAIFEPWTPTVLWVRLLHPEHEGPLSSPARRPIRQLVVRHLLVFLSFPT
jgi:hypothetical protein